MSILLAGVTGCRNRGVEALVATSLNQFASRWPGETRTVLSSDAAFDREALPKPVCVLDGQARYFGLQPMLRTPLGLALKARAYARGRDGDMLGTQKAIADASVVVLSGGDIFSSDYGVGFLRQQAAMVAHAQSLGRPVVFLAHSIGPFRTDAEIALMRPLLDRAALITVRESASRDYLISAMGLAPGDVHLTADIAFLMEPSAGPRADAASAVSGLDPDSEFVAFAPSEGITSFSSATDRAQHDAAWCAAIRAVLDTTRHQVLLVPHVQDNRRENDDSQIALRLLEALDFNPRVRATFGPWTAADYKALIGRARLLVGERMHACIAGLSSGVPTVAVGYSVKARGIMGDIFGGDAESMGLIVSVADFVEPGKADRMVRDALGSLRAVRDRLASARPVMAERAERNFDLLAPVIAQKLAA